jgi:hypothetical protein
MAVMPGAHFLNAVQGTLMSRYDTVTIHTIVGYAPVNPSHFSTRADGYVWQSRDTRYRSAANLNGNHRAVTIENEDHGPRFGPWSGSNVPGFTPEQIEANAQICAWANRVHGIPLVLCPDSKPASRGISYHREGCDGNFAGFAYPGRVPGGELWSNAFGKVCPGDRRITQLITQVIPRARQIAGLDPGGVFMALSDQQQQDMYNAIDRTHRRVMGFLRQRWYVEIDGELAAVPEGTPDAIPATTLDNLDGRYLVDLITAAQEQAQHATQAATAAAQAAVATADKVDQISVGGVDLDALAVRVADELDRRARDDDPATGPRS